MQLSKVAVVVEDYDDAIAFYVDVLGFELTEDSPVEGKRWVTVRPPGGSTEILLAREVQDQPWGRVAVIEDLYGNLIDLIEPRP